MSAPKRKRSGPHTPSARTTHHTASNGESQTSAAVLEALTFLAGARCWIDHALVGHIPPAEAAIAAQLLLTRAEQFVLAA